MWGKLFMKSTGEPCRAVRRFGLGSYPNWRRNVSVAALVASFCGAGGASAMAETLAEALASTYATNPTLAAERAQLRSIDEDAAQARAGWRPTVTISTTYAQSLGRQNLARFLGASQSNLIKEHNEQYSAVLEASQPLYQGGQTRAAIKSSDALVRAGRANLTATEQSILLQAITAYFDVIRDRATVELTINNVAVLKRQLQASEDRFRVGEITRTDVAQSQARLSRSESDLARARATLAESEARYEELIGHAPDGELIKTPGLPALPGSLDAALAQADAANPDVVAAQENESAAKHSVRQQKGALMPSLEVVASIDRSEDLDLVNSNDTNRQAQVRMSLPLYQGGAEYSAVRQAKHVSNQRRLQVVEAQRDVRQQTATAWNDLVAAKAAIVSDQEQVKANRVALDGVNQEAQVGSRTVLNVLDAEQELLDSQVSLVQSQRDEYVTAFQLLAAVGGLTAQSLNLDVAYYDPEANFNKVRWKVVGFGTESE